jgi:cell division septal protein FtsQ
MERSIALPGRLRLPPARRIPIPATAGRALRSLLARLWQRRAGRIALIVALAAVPLLPGGWLLLRNSSLVAVSHVRITGVRGPESRAIDAALNRAARRMSTLNLNTGALRAAVAPFPVVRSLRAQPSFPHSLRIEVVEQLPVAALVTVSGRSAVAADGVVLGPALLSHSLPTVKGWLQPPVGGRLHDPGLLGATALLGAAPRRLARRVERVYMGARGLTAAMRNGLVVYFGDGSLAHAKWLSLAAVLASSTSAGALYVDVRVPSHPAAGFPAGAGPSSEGQASSSTESTVTALASGLEKEGGTSSGKSAASSAEPSSSEAAQGSGGEASSGETSSSSGEASAGSSESSEASG